MQKTVPIVDLFAGPGGLGEGFSALDSGQSFNIVASIEMDPHAHKTLQLRAFYRLLLRENPDGLDSYYAYCHGQSENPWDESNLKQWDKAKREAILGELGTHHGNAKLTHALTTHNINGSIPWVLIGGPPCQAYSLAGRARNYRKKGYVPENDYRHFLYKEYLSVIRNNHPTVFVMENVKGILSSKINGAYIFHSILRDLSNPGGTRAGKPVRYKIYSLVKKTCFQYGMDPAEINPTDFVIESESYGIPQARHRVILLGIREDINVVPDRLKRQPLTSISDAISYLPKIRSSLSKKSGDIDNQENWTAGFRGNVKRLISEAKGRPDLVEICKLMTKRVAIGDWPTSAGANILPKGRRRKSSPNNILDNWYRDDVLNTVLNHESRSHMLADLRRYLYASAFAKVRGASPKGVDDFDLDGLVPKHKNWKSGKFADRFRVQVETEPAHTITSHISKDGHQFIHPDPTQCRTFTVREAARAQTFPDNYFFQGTRSQQFHQVGNAVPPLLSNQIANIVKKVVKKARQLL